MSTQFNNTLYQFDSDNNAKKEGKTCFPVTGIAWKNTDIQTEKLLLGSMCDGSIMRWRP